MDTNETQDKTGIGFELPDQALRRPPRREVEEILGVPDPEEPLKSERVEEALKAMPEWELTLEGDSITRVKELPTPEVASLYTAYVTALAGALDQPVNVSVFSGMVLVTLYARNRGGCMSGLTESILDFARQIG
jgi:pterin-4a-carbinolamine dehydratase